MNTEELLKPRKKVMIDYPNSDFEVGQIIEFDVKGTEFTGNMDWITKMTKHKNGGSSMRSIKFFEPYPHIFKDLSWWEERKEEDMPQYVKNKNETQFVTRIHKVTKWDCELPIPECIYENHWRIASQLLPATQSEYENQKQ